MRPRDHNGVHVTRGPGDHKGPVDTMGDQGPHGGCDHNGGPQGGLGTIRRPGDHRGLGSITGPGNPNGNWAHNSLPRPQRVAETIRGPRDHKLAQRTQWAQGPHGGHGPQWHSRILMGPRENIESLGPQGHPWPEHKGAWGLQMGPRENNGSLGPQGGPWSTRGPVGHKGARGPYRGPRVKMRTTNPKGAWGSQRCLGTTMRPRDHNGVPITKVLGTTRGVGAIPVPRTTMGAQGI